MADRPQLVKFRPEWENSVFKKWASSYIHKNSWRIRNFFDEEEALQECGALVFAKCLHEYKYTVDNPKWFMALFKTSVINQVNKYAIKSSKEREAISSYREIKKINTEYSEGSLYSILTSASEELQSVLKVVANAPSEFLDILLDNSATDKRWSRRLCRLCKVNMNEDIITELRSLLKS